MYFIGASRRSKGYHSCVYAHVYKIQSECGRNFLRIVEVPLGENLLCGLSQCIFAIETMNSKLRTFIKNALNATKECIGAG